MIESMTYEKIVDYINDIPRFAGKNSIDETSKILDVLTDNQSLPPVIHVAGTNGKGSVCSFLHSILQESGKRVGLFISPHLIDIRERIKINNEEISEDDFTQSFDAVGKAYKMVNASHPSFFEYLFLMAMSYFYKEKPDVIILETGLGGALDATNSCKDKAVTIITEIGLDHQQYLGDTVEKIAREKAGIIRKNVPLVMCDKRPQSSQAIIDEYRKINGDDKGLMIIKPDRILIKSQDDGGITFDYKDNTSIHISSVASYQCENAILAMEALKAAFGDMVSKEDIYAGLSKAFWPGRLQKLEKNLYIDGAHNIDGIEAFLGTASKLAKGKSAYLMFGVVSDKDYSEMIELLANANIFSEVIITGIDSSRNTEKDKLIEEFGRFDNWKATYINNSADALNELKAKGEEDSLRFIAGSLYLVGEVLNIYKAQKIK